MPLLYALDFCKSTCNLGHQQSSPPQYSHIESLAPTAPEILIDSRSGFRLVQHIASIAYLHLRPTCQRILIDTHGP